MRRTPFDPTPEENGARELPVFNSQSGELWFAGQCIRSRKRPAPNQELILEAFEEEGWPLRIDDPLLGGCDDPRARLHDALRQLNARLRPRLIEFFRDGTGQGIGWRIVKTPKPIDRAG